jgi:hypothetical protein
MAIASFGLLFIVPSAAVGFLLAPRMSRTLTFLAMMLVFAATVLVVWSSFGPLFGSTEGRLILAVQTLVALTIVGVRLPLVSRLYSL